MAPVVVVQGSVKTRRDDPRRNTILPLLTGGIVANVHETVRRNAVCLVRGILIPVLAHDATPNAYLISGAMALADMCSFYRVRLAGILAESLV